MATKVYGVDGQREAILTVPLANGRNTLRLEFTRGNNQRGAYYKPATYVSVSAAEQAMIESSPMFKTGTIRLVRTIGGSVQDETPASPQKPVRNSRRQQTQTAPVTEPEPTNEIADAAAEGGDNGSMNAAAEGGDNGGMNFPEVTTIEQARVALKAHGANAGVLMNETAMRNYMARNGITFPNFKF